MHLCLLKVMIASLEHSQIWTKSALWMDLDGYHHATQLSTTTFKYLLMSEAAKADLFSTEPLLPS